MINLKNDSERGEYLENFSGKYKKGLEELLEHLETFGPSPVPPDPSSLDMDDERTLEELEIDELQRVESVLCKTLGVDIQNPDFEVRRYNSFARMEAKVPGKIEVRVLKTNRERVFLQEMTFLDGEVRWVVGGDTNI